VSVNARSLPVLTIVAVVSFAAGALVSWSVARMQAPGEAEACFYELLRNKMPGGSAMAICDDMFPSSNLLIPQMPSFDAPPDSN
jgi:hypothetical protein